jgi:hypothetical protein
MYKLTNWLFRKTRTIEKAIDLVDDLLDEIEDGDLRKSEIINLLDQINKVLDKA